MKSGRITREEAITFLLAHIVVEKNRPFELNQTTLFTLMTLAAEAESTLAKEQGLIPHEVIESLADRFFEQTRP